MPTITVTAPDSAMAMDEVVRQLGSDAYILSTSQQDGLVQIKASLDPLNSSPRRPKAIQTVFEKEMEKQFTVSATAAVTPDAQTCARGCLAAGLCRGRLVAPNRRAIRASFGAGTGAIPSRSKRSCHVES